MHKALIIESAIIIDAPLQEVWDHLINPEKTKAYMFGCEVISDFKVGSPVLWQATVEGKETVFVKGHVVSIDSPVHFAYTTFDPHSTMEDIPENYLTVTYNLKEENGKVRLSITHGDFAKVADGESRYKDTTANGGWDAILENIKKLAEGE